MWMNYGCLQSNAPTSIDFIGIFVLAWRRLRRKWCFSRPFFVCVPCIKKNVTLNPIFWTLLGNKATESQAVDEWENPGHLRHHKDPGYNSTTCCTIISAMSGAGASRVQKSLKSLAFTNKLSIKISVQQPRDPESCHLSLTITTQRNLFLDFQQKWWIFIT